MDWKRKPLGAIGAALALALLAGCGGTGTPSLAPAATPTKPAGLSLAASPTPVQAVSLAPAATPSPAPSPSPTPPPGISLPRPTATAAAAVSLAADRSACPKEVVAPLVGKWAKDPSLKADLGCPTGPGASVWSARQPFQQGLMLWRQDALQIYVLYNDGTYETQPDTFSAVDAEWIGVRPPSPELQEPKRGFGKLWRDFLGREKAKIGWATAEEKGLKATIQPFEHGTAFLAEDGAIYLLLAEGRWRSP